MYIVIKNIEIINWIIHYYYYNHGLDLCCGCNIDDKNNNNKNELIHFICKHGISDAIINTIKFYVHHGLNLRTLNYDNVTPLMMVKNQIADIYFIKIQYILSGYYKHGFGKI